MPRRYVVLDVFTDRSLAGNPLAVVLDAGGLDGEAMQRIAREFNLSETVFVLPPDEPRHNARIRIFTPARELPFAGHPTVGTAISLALEKRQPGGPNQFVIVMEEGVGPVRCGVRTGDGRGDDRGFAEFDCPRLPEEAGAAPDRSALAAALGLGLNDVGFENHLPSRWSAGVPFLCVPVKALPVLAALTPAAAPAASALAEGMGLFLYTRHAPEHLHDFRARMFAPGMGLAEDPATGSAVAAFAGAIARFDAPRDGDHTLLVEQGVEMGRPSLIRLGLSMAGGRLSGARIGGDAVVVARGELLI